MSEPTRTPDDATLQFIQQPSPADFSPQEIDILRKVNQKIAGNLDLRQTIGYLFEATREICECDRVSIAFLSDDRQRVTSQIIKADYEPLMLKEGYTEDLAGSSLQWVIEHGRCRLIGDLAEYARQFPESRSTQLLLLEGVRSSMTCPLLVDERVVGILFRSSKQPNMFTPHQVRIHLAITERLSQAVEKAYRIEQLSRANAAYMELLSFVTHELKSPVGSLVMTAETLLAGDFGELNDIQRDRIERIVFKSQYLQHLISDYLNLSRIESDQLEVNPREIAVGPELLQSAVEFVQPWIEGKEMTLDTQIDPPDAKATVDADLMLIVLTNLLNNAAKYGRKGGAIVAKFAVDEQEFRGSVRNEGAGFTEAQRSQLFRKFSRLDNPDLPKAKGTGVGLYTSWRIVTAHGGKITARSEPGQWAEFRFTIPQSKA